MRPIIIPDVTSTPLRSPDYPSRGPRRTETGSKVLQMLVKSKIDVML